MRATTGTEVIGHFAGRSARANGRLRAWRADPSKVDVVPRVESHTVSVLYEQTRGDVISVCKRTEHALGEVTKREITNVEAVRDWHPAFAFTHVLHFAVEALGALPTFEQFRNYCREDPIGRATLWEPAQEMVSVAARRVGSRVARDAMRWRIGNAYYSFLREVFVLAVLRERSVDVQVHPLADALFRVDLWVNDINVSLFIGNELFRAGDDGRKDRPEQLLGDASPPFRFHSIQLRTQHRFGVVHLPTLSDVQHAAAELARVLSA
jgi:hypothetical protein